jgi:2-polyprenyl-3-methyl-5-hydroxy-6-metoxy-1,4-benzoquinol methylase
MFHELERINERPAVFSQQTVADLWTDPHISEGMLRFHLDGSVDVSSHRTELVEAAVSWIREAFQLKEGSRVLDLGCGPGLYARRLAQTGPEVTGIDFSSRSISYAREAAAREGLQVSYINEDYLAWKPDGRFDLVLMIMRDYCAIGPDQRRALLDKIESLLAPEGAFLFDVDSLAALKARTEKTWYAPAPEGGFFSPDPYFEFLASFVYPEDAVSLEKHVIVEATRTRTLYDWVQHFSPESLGAELAASGLEIASVLGDVAGRAFDPEAREFAVVARRRG